MEYQSVSDLCVSLCTDGACDSPDLAAKLVRSALSDAGLCAWKRMEVDIFPSGRNTLIVARPAADVTVAVADWLLPYIER